MSLAENLTAFEKELKARALLDLARECCAPFGLRADQLQRRPRDPVAALAVVEARARFARCLYEDKAWSTAMIGALLGYKRNTIFYLMGRGTEDRRLTSVARRAVRIEHLLSKRGRS